MPSQKYKKKIIKFMKIPNLLVHREMEIKTIIRYHSPRSLLFFKLVIQLLAKLKYMAMDIAIGTVNWEKSLWRST